MEKIQLVDLKNQYLKIEKEIDKAVLDVIKSTAYINGPEVKSFQSDLEKYLNAKHVIPCGNGTDALQIALMALDIQPGDEVLTPSFTYVATCEVVALLGATPVFVDVYPDTFNIDVEDLERKITDKSKVIIPVHLYGQCADMENLLKVAKKHNLKVVEDTAQGIGANHTFSNGDVSKAGTMGDIGTISFFPSKNLGAYGDGGAMVTNNDELAGKLRMIANHGQSKRYYHDKIGVNSRLDSIQAAILRVKLRYLDDYIKARNEAAEYYHRAFESTPHITAPVTASFSNHVYHQYTVKLHDVDRDALQKHLADKGIPTNIYYPLANHKQEAFTGMVKPEHLDVTEELSRQVLSFPIHTELTDEQLEHITQSTLEFVNG